jgi:hypothetical protein
MVTQVLGTAFHCFINYILVIQLEMGVLGTGLSMVFTYTFLLIGNII